MSPRARDTTTAPSIADTVSVASRAAFLRRTPAPCSVAAKASAQSVERGGGRGARAGLLLGLGGDGEHRAARAEVAACERIAPVVDPGVQHGDGVTVARGVAERLGHRAGRVAHGLAGELGLAAREVVVDRAARGGAVGDDVAQPGAREPALAEQHRGAARHLLADVRVSIFVAVGYDGDHSPRRRAGATACETGRVGRRAAVRARARRGRPAGRSTALGTPGGRGSQRWPRAWARASSGLPTLDERQHVLPAGHVAGRGPRHAARPPQRPVVRASTQRARPGPQPDDRALTAQGALGDVRLDVHRS